MSGAQSRDIGVAQCWIFREAAIDPCLDGSEIEVEHPQQYTERPEILALPTFAFAEPEGFQRFEIQAADIGGDKLVVIERIGVARILFVTGLF